MALPEFVKSLVEPWSSLYADSKAIVAFTRFLHLGGLLLGGGAAVAFDRISFRADSESPAFRSHHQGQLRRVHRVVVVGLGLIVVSGLMMLAADLEAFLASWVFWIKMTLVLALAVNGYVITRIDASLRPDAPAGWTALRVTSGISFILWFAIVLAGTLLVLTA